MWPCAEAGEELVGLGAKESRVFRGLAHLLLQPDVLGRQLLELLLELPGLELKLLLQPPRFLEGLSALLLLLANRRALETQAENLSEQRVVLVNNFADLSLAAPVLAELGIVEQGDHGPAPRRAQRRVLLGHPRPRPRRLCEN